MSDAIERHYLANCWCPIGEHPRSGLPTPLELTYGIPPRGGLDREIDRARHSEARRRGGLAPWEADLEIRYSYYPADGTFRPEGSDGGYR